MKTRSFPRSAKLFVGGLAVALAGTFTLAAMAAPHGGPGHGMHGGGMMGSPERMGRMVDRMLDEVKASDAQRAQVKQIVQAAAADLKGQREAARELRQRAMQLFTQPTVDANAVEALRQQMLQQHDQASRRMTQAMLDVSRVLTPEQRTQLAERMKQRREMFERHRRERESLGTPRS